MADESRKRLLADIKSIQTTSDFSDLIITCADDKYPLHKNIICARSSVLAKAVKFPGKEAEQNTINLSDNEQAIVKLMIQYMYEAEYDPALPAPDASPVDGIAPQKGSHSCSKKSKGHNCSYNSDYYPERCQIFPYHRCGYQCSYDCSDFLCGDCLSRVNGDASQLLVHAKMYEMADKYGIAGLKDLCTEKYKHACRKFWDDAKFAESAYHVYCTTPSRDKGMRNIVCKTLSDHMSLLEKPEVEDLMTEFNGLAFGLLFDKAKQSGWCNK